MSSPTPRPEPTFRHASATHVWPPPTGQSSGKRSSCWPRKATRSSHRYVERYGRSVNTDDARELFPAYRADRSRAGLVQRPATELSERVYARLLDAGRGKGGTVIFLAGGSGSGKTTALRRMMRERPLDDAITFDGTFADHAADLRRIRQALDQGYEVSVDLRPCRGPAAGTRQRPGTGRADGG